MVLYLQTAKTDSGLMNQKRHSLESYEIRFKERTRRPAGDVRNKSSSLKKEKQTKKKQIKGD